MTPIEKLVSEHPIADFDIDPVCSHELRVTISMNPTSSKFQFLYTNIIQISGDGLYVIFGLSSDEIPVYFDHPYRMTKRNARDLNRQINKVGKEKILNILRARLIL